MPDKSYTIKLVNIPSIPLKSIDLGFREVTFLLKSCDGGNRSYGGLAMLPDDNIRLKFHDILRTIISVSTPVLIVVQHWRRGYRKIAEQNFLYQSGPFHMD